MVVFLCIIICVFTEYIRMFWLCFFTTDCIASILLHLEPQKKKKFMNTSSSCRFSKIRKLINVCWLVLWPWKQFQATFNTICCMWTCLTCCMLHGVQGKYVLGKNTCHNIIPTILEKECFLFRKNRWNFYQKKNLPAACSATQFHNFRWKSRL